MESCIPSTSWLTRTQLLYTGPPVYAPRTVQAYSQLSLFLCVMSDSQLPPDQPKPSPKLSPVPDPPPPEEEPGAVGETINRILSGAEELLLNEEQAKNMESSPRPSPPASSPPRSAQSNPIPASKVTDFTDIHIAPEVGLGASYHRAEIEADEAKPPSDDGGQVIELVKWVPTLPQLFVYLSLTLFLINFFWFIAICTETTGVAYIAPNQVWFKYVSWIFLVLMSILNFVYNYLLKKHLLRALFATIFSLIVFITYFYAPFTSSDHTRAYQATFTFFRGLFLLVIVLLYSLAYRQDIVPPREHLPGKLRNFVVDHRLDME